MNFGVEAVLYPQKLRRNSSTCTTTGSPVAAHGCRGVWASPTSTPAWTRASPRPPSSCNAPSGHGTTAWSTRSCLGALAARLARPRIAFYRELAKRDPEQRVFLQGWLNRVRALQAQLMNQTEAKTSQW